MKEIGTATRLPSNGKKRKHGARPGIHLLKNEEEDSLIEPSIRKTITRRFGLIMAVAISVTAIVGIGTFQQKPRYLGKFQLLVAPGSEQVSQPTQEPIPDPNQKNTQINPLPLKEDNGDETEYDTNIQILRSPKLLKPILQKISPRYPDVDYKYLTQKPETQEEPFKITRLKNTKILEISYEDENPEKILFVLNNVADAYLRYGLEIRQAELKQAIAFVNAQLPKLQQRVEQYEKKLQLLRQQYNFINPEQYASQLSKQLVDLETQFFETEVKLKETNSLYTSLKKQVGLNTQEALTSSYLSESPRYQNLLNQLQQVDLELAKQSTIFLEDSPIITALKEKRENLKSLLEEEAAKALGNNAAQPTTTSTKIDSPSSVRLNLNQQLVQSANQIEVLQTRYSSLEKQIQNLKAQIKQMPLIARQYTDIQRQINVAQDSLNRFLEAQEKIQIQAAQKASPWELISEPELLKHSIYPIAARNLTLGMVGGVLLGIFAAVVAQKLDRKFHIPEDIKEVTKLPILGYIPWQKNLHKRYNYQDLELLHYYNNIEPEQNLTSLSNSGAKLTPSFNNFSAFFEACLTMCANIRLLESQSGTSSVPQSFQSLKSIVITSATLGEGKSTIALSLAQAAAVMGQRVLLIESDLRRPQYHQWIDVPHQQGLTHVLTTGLDPATAIQKVPQWDNLSIMMAGNIADNPTKLLAGERMQQLMEQLHQDSQYDLVIYDTPPLLGFADTKILATLTEGIILITKMGKTDRQAFAECINELKQSPISILGLVINGVSRRYQNLTYYYNSY